MPVVTSCVITAEPVKLLYATDAKYRFDITFPNSFRNIERPKNYRHKDFIYSVLFFGSDGGGG